MSAALEKESLRALLSDLEKKLKAIGDDENGLAEESHTVQKSLARALGVIEQIEQEKDKATLNFFPESQDFLFFLQLDAVKIAACVATAPFVRDRLINFLDRGVEYFLEPGMPYVVKRLVLKSQGDIPMADVVKIFKNQNDRLKLLLLFKKQALDSQAQDQEEINRLEEQIELIERINSFDFSRAETGIMADLMGVRRDFLHFLNQPFSLDKRKASILAAFQNSIEKLEETLATASNLEKQANFQVISELQFSLLLRYILTFLAVAIILAGLALMGLGAAVLITGKSLSLGLVTLSPALGLAVLLSGAGAIVLLGLGLGIKALYTHSTEERGRFPRIIKTSQKTLKSSSFLGSFEDSRASLFPGSASGRPLEPKSKKTRRPYGDL